MSRFARISLAAGAAAALSLSACSSGDPASADEISSLSFGVVPSDSAESTYDNWGLFIELAEEELGVEIELFEATANPAVIESAIAGNLDMVYQGPMGTMLMQDSGAPLRTVGNVNYGPQEPPGETIGVVLADSHYTDLSDLVGEDVCFNNPASTTGYLYPANGFLQLGIDPETDINAIFVGDHQSVVRTVFEGECAAGFSFRQMVEETVPKQNDDIEAEDFRRIWEAETIGGGITISTELPEEMQERLSDFLLSTNGDNIPEGYECPERLERTHADGTPYCGLFSTFWGMSEVDGDYWDPAREICAATEAPACQGS
ncbi:phosphate/phosphite/phosphonate ABC transporter substrate-binding protein [Brevibacterium album]|uniref:phosphate/phosphite/phosphonate ABC transporter substrate-binding protein n=1 Tax=Brevibacterium album TaxID=417948 RepID=UPI00048F8823|nr:phosphate/phosphite/phosphonate ABC transporter substrate-binding protein [Brevibacterium album]